ncbi:uncharacterized protein LOC101853719 [Aplysia californica]|uniref:Uncharacterized protein LOC101853719 n=1 Tax=Aplysia californica TaxID=6500 RepID=A0ABM0JZK2_APLCA|nr:uncharacterized protein LOC101853719 [Aplysia californica]
MFNIPVFVPHERSQRPRQWRCPMSQPQSHTRHGPQHPFMMFGPTSPMNSQRCCNESYRRAERNDNSFRPELFESDFAQSLLTQLFGEGECSHGQGAQQQTPPAAAPNNENVNSTCTEHPMMTSGNPFMDILGDIFKNYDEDDASKNKPQKWKKVVDCTGFKSDNIRVKILNRTINVRAVKEEASSDGSTCSTRMEKCIELPQNVNVKEVSCRLFRNSKLLIEAPIIAQPREKLQNTQNECHGNTPNKFNQEREPQLKMKIFPNGDMVLGMVPRANNQAKSSKKAEQTEAKSEEQKTCGNREDPACMTMKESGGNGYRRKEQKTKTENTEVNIPVKMSLSNVGSADQGKTCPINEKEDTQVSTTSVNEELYSKKVEPRDLEQELAHAQEDATASEETSVLTTSSARNDEEAPETPQNKGQEVPFVVKMSTGDENEDAFSQISHDSENSFVVLSDPEKANKKTDVSENSLESTAQAESQDSSDRKDAGSIIRSVVETLARGLDADEKSNQNAKPHEVIGNIMQYVAQKAPEDLKNFIVNNDGSFPRDVMKFVVDRASEETPDKETPDNDKTVDQSQTASGKYDSTVSDREENSLEKEFQIRLEMPCFGPESISVTMDDTQRVLNIRANKEGDQSPTESVHKTISVPDTVDVQQLQCHFQDGMLTINAPFKQDDKENAREIPINV